MIVDLLKEHDDPSATRSGMLDQGEVDCIEDALSLARIVMQCRYRREDAALLAERVLRRAGVDE